MNQIATIHDPQPFRQSTDAAGLCRDIVLKTATRIQGRRYVTVEGWQAIAIAHGCAASADHIERVTDEGAAGFKAMGIIRRMSDGAEIARAEGFLGDDEQMWSKRPVYARRAMVQTRAISRACRSAFAHVVVMMDAGLMTTPAEEIPHDPETGEVTEAKEPAARQKLDGPHASKTALRKAINDLIGAVRKADTDEAITALLNEHKRTINQARRDWPILIDGDPNIAEDVGLAGAVAERRAAVSDGGMVTGMIASMKECDTKLSLANWYAANESVIDQLDGAESRAFQLAYELHESSINLMDQATA